MRNGASRLSVSVYLLVQLTDGLLKRLNVLLERRGPLLLLLDKALELGDALQLPHPTFRRGHAVPGSFPLELLSFLLIGIESKKPN